MPSSSDVQTRKAFLQSRDCSIGIGITSRSTHATFERCIEHILPRLPPNHTLFLNDDTTWKNQGAAGAKNKCLEHLKECDFIFLLYDTAYPIQSDWWQPFLKHSWTYGCHYISPTQNTLSSEGLHSIDSISDTFQFLSKECLLRCGGFRTGAEYEGKEHAEYASRVFHNGLNPYVYCDFKNSLQSFHILDNGLPTKQPILSTIPHYVPFFPATYTITMFDKRNHSREHLRRWLDVQTTHCIVFHTGRKPPVYRTNVGCVSTKEPFWEAVQTCFLENRGYIHAFNIVDFSRCAKIPEAERGYISIGTYNEQNIFLHIPSKYILPFCEKASRHTPLTAKLCLEIGTQINPSLVRTIDMRPILLIEGNPLSLHTAIQKWSSPSWSVLGVTEGATLSCTHSILSSRSIFHTIDWVVENYPNALGVWKLPETMQVTNIEDCIRTLQENVCGMSWKASDETQGRLYWLSSLDMRFLRTNKGVYSSERDIYVSIQTTLPIRIVKPVQTREEILSKLRVFCIYFPQFHTFPENDKNFYTGFTDIVNLNTLIQEKPSGHYLTPSLNELGLRSILDYDLAKHETLIQRQIDILKDYEIDGFAMYYYWFTRNDITGKHMLMRDVINRFFDNSLRMSNRKVYFLWANEDWTSKPWFGNSKYRIENTYDTESLKKNTKNLMKYFQHDNYLKIDDKPVLFVHHPHCMKESEIDDLYTILNTSCIEAGFYGIHLSFHSTQNKNTYSKYGSVKMSSQQTTYDYKQVESTDFEHRIQVMKFDFDNEARMYKPKRVPHVRYTNVTEESQERFLHNILNHYVQTPSESNLDNLLLVNAWNEWGERMSVEPSEQKGYYFLDMLYKCIRGKQKVRYTRFESGYSGEHRGGWKDVCMYMDKHMGFDDKNTRIFYDILDAEFLFRTGKVQTKPWSGIIHCTPLNESHLDAFDLKKMFANPVFLESLQMCQGIFTLASNVTEYCRAKFHEMGLRIPVHTWKHPIVDTQVPMFSFDAYTRNPKKKLLQIGQQLRNVTSIGIVEAPNHTKLWLTGTQNMERIRRMVKKECAVRDRTYVDVPRMYLDTHEEYDALLTENIVCLDLVDAAANNTILECIVRNTPILVNKVGGVVDYLGEGYPFYYTNLEDIPSYLTSEKILEAHTYLRSMKKSDITMEHFSNKLRDTLCSQTYVPAFVHYTSKGYMRDIETYRQLYSLTAFPNNVPRDEFRYMCFRYLEYARRWTLPPIQLHTKHEAVLIEFRPFPHLEFLLRNAIHKLGVGWSHTIVCGNRNYGMMEDICTDISKNIRIIKLPYDNITIDTYNTEICLNRNFWNMLIGDKILLYQEDTMIFTSNIDDFVQFDYIGAPWCESQSELPNHCVGNGGFSLRTRRVMLDTLEKTESRTIRWNQEQNIHVTSGIRLQCTPEDIFFSKQIQVLNTGRVADKESAKQFSSESIVNPTSFGGHAFYNFDTNWKERMYTHNVLAGDIPNTLSTNKIRFVISMTTTPNRFHCIRNVIDGLYRQTVRPERIYIHVPDMYKRTGEPYSIPDWISNYDIVRIHHCGEDVGPITKLMPILSIFAQEEDVYVITTDDDFRMPPYVLEMYTKRLENMTTKCVIGMAGCYVYNDEIRTTVDGNSQVDIIEGFGMPAYHRSFFPPAFVEYVAKCLENRDCFLSDDVVISNWLALSNVKRYQVGEDNCSRFLLQDSEYSKDSGALHILSHNISKYPRCYRFLQEQQCFGLSTNEELSQRIQTGTLTLKPE